MTRPRSFTALAVTAIVFGSLAMWTAGAILPDALSDEALPPLAPGEPGASFNLVFGHFRVLAVLQFAASVLATVAGVALLWMRRWAAYALEALAWLALLWLVVFTGLFLREVAVHGTAHAVSPEQRKVMVSLVLMPLGIMVFWSMPLALAIWVLRRPENRAGLR